MNTALGLDFGTTNTVMAGRKGRPRGGPGPVEAAAFRHGPDEFSAFRSVVCFWQELQEARKLNRSDAGPWAIERFVTAPEETRFLQSFKTFAASPLFDYTQLSGKRYFFEDILENFFRGVLSHAPEGFGTPPLRLVVGRPVEFAGANPDSALARRRYEDAFRRFGIAEIHHVMEPVAAAYFYAQRLASDATILVGDFGGGTSDFSIVHFEVSQAGVRAHPLSHAGIGIAGDSFDYRLIDAIVSPRLGKGSQYRSWGKVLEMPASFYTKFARWNEVCLMKAPATIRDLTELARQSLEPERLEDFIALIESDAVYGLYRTVSEVKARLSLETSAPFAFRSAGVTIEATVHRSDFETWIARDIERMAECVDAALRKASLDHSRIDKVFLTGGTSFVPAVRRMFADRFGAAKLESGDELLSIAYGLALIAEAEDISRWTVPLEEEGAGTTPPRSTDECG